MGRRFVPARRTGTTVPRVQACVVTAAQTFKWGALVATAAAGTISECGADPTIVLGVALQDAFSGPGNEVANSSQVVATTGTINLCSVAIADREQEFSGRMTNAGATVAPLQTHIDQQYGVVKVGNDWTIDETDTTNVVVEITDIVEAQGGDPGFHIFKFLESDLERP